MFNSWFFWSFLNFSNNNFLNLSKTINISARQVMLYIHQDSALLITACMYVFLWKSFEGTSIVHCLFICCIEGRYWKIHYETRAITMFRRCHDEFSIHTWDVYEQNSWKIRAAWLACHRNVFVWTVQRKTSWLLSRLWSCPGIFVPGICSKLWHLRNHDTTYPQRFAS